MQNTWLIGRECKRGDALSGPALIGRGLDQRLRAPPPSRRRASSGSLSRLVLEKIPPSWQRII